ncbi:ABC transporter substrate-binding protein [Limobrevibacterium gyesilva]|uniref:ABC transporter substrate-binding protein n=1 Tax=Limobrevibacterium gyesilva TaxID=2991712 RepID=A0AA41YIH8_9PROT|nr:ABC transporter substrate-binding protein [Limobrevibacterium gyesilva]MCW3474209.1 ABC transporter substrate-binding protein [Limobrevibacterium gyesilva]
MLGTPTRLLAAATMVAGLLAATTLHAQEPKRGGILKIYQRDSPASASIHEEATYSTNVPFMAVFNNLVIYKQDVPQNSLDSIVPELATSWAWSPDNLRLTFKLREGVKWHDGKPFTSKDVKCTFDLLMDKATDKFRKNPRQTWYQNVADVTTNGDFEATFRVNRPQPSLLALLASGYTPIYPCHVSARDMRVHPIGTGPFKFVEFKQNESIKLVRNPNYWKPGRPYLDGLEFPIITNRSTAMLAFIAGKIDMTFPTEVTAPILKDIRAQAPKAICSFGPTNVSTNLIVNREMPPFDNADIRRAMALTLDRQAFIDILSEGKSDIGGSMLPQPAGVWGMPPDMIKTMVGYDPDVQKNRAEARAIMERLGYGPNKRLKMKVSTRNIPSYRDPAVILIDQLKEIYIDAELDVVETSTWFAKVARKDYSVGLNLTGNAVDDPDQTFYENYACKSERNYTQYCNPELEKLFDKQSAETNLEARKKLVWEIDRKLQDDVARPIILHIQAGVCWQPDVHGFTPMVNSSYNGYRFEDLWLDR